MLVTGSSNFNIQYHLNYLTAFYVLEHIYPFDFFFKAQQKTREWFFMHSDAAI